MPRKVFTAGEVLAAADVNSFLMDQSVLTFTDSTARESAVSTATAPAGLVTYLEDTDAFEYWNGTAYEPFGGGSEEPVFISYLVIGGGGGGGANSGFGRAGGGGGAGGYRCSFASENTGGGLSTELPLLLANGTHTVTIGAGGAGGANSTTNAGSNGVASRVGPIFGFQGGGGGGFFQTSSSHAAARPKNGASGGGMGDSGNIGSRTLSGGGGSIGQGFKGGDYSDVTADVGSSCGGGGAGGAGGNNSTAAGAGVSSSITGSAVTRANGGAGNAGATAQSANTGIGGRGSTGSSAGGNGGSGIIILRFASSSTLTVGAGLTSTSSTVGSDTVVIITAGTGDITWEA